MALGKYQPPTEYKDEDKYGPFTKGQLLIVIPFGLIGFGLGYLLYNMGFTGTGIALGMIIAGIGIALARISLPKNMYLYGGGLPVRTILFRMILRRLNRCLYCKNYDEEKNR